MVWGKADLARPFYPRRVLAILAKLGAYHLAWMLFRVPCGFPFVPVRSGYV